MWVGQSVSEHHESPSLGMRIVKLLLHFSVLLLLATTNLQNPALAQDPAAAQNADSVAAAINRLPPRYRRWLQTVAGLISQPELDYFLGLSQDYRRDAFMEAFWEVRDPDPQTPRNELRTRWQEYLSSAGGLPYGDPRFLLYLLNGPPGRYTLPDGRPVSRCFSRSRELEIWFYGGSERTTRRFVVVFAKQGVDVPYEVYHYGGRLRPVQRSGGLPVTDIRLLCADELINYALYEISLHGGYEDFLGEVLSPPLPSPEWLATFSASTTDLPEGAETFDVGVKLDHPARKQSRTAVRVLLGVPLAQAPGRRFDGELFHNFLVNGEVLRDERLFESFHYRFEGPTPDAVAEIPLGFTRYLRPGTVTLRVLLEDVFGNRFAQVVREIDVPSPKGLPPVPVAAEADPEEPEGPSLRLIAPSTSVHQGMVRFRARARGEFDQVAFFLDDKQVLSKRRPPYSVELNLGSAPAPHRVRVVGFVGDQEVATDQLWLNQGAQRFRVRMVEPRPGAIYPGSLTARVEVITPDGHPPQRLELWINDDRVATLESPPYTKSLRVPNSQLAAVRAVAYLADGTVAEDAVVVNAAGFVEVVDVELVELRVLVTDAAGEPIRDLAAEDFQVLEDSVRQEIQRFEPTSTSPLQAALLIDRSASMEPHLKAVTEAALAFTRASLRSPEDRVAVLSFADETTVDAAFTDSAGQVERALAGLVAIGGTALYDSVSQAFNSFDGISRETALLLFSDGQDEGSRLTFEQALETARHAGVALYPIGLEETYPEKRTRRALEDLAAETGGRAYFLAGLEELAQVYAEILAELRSRYLVAYPSTSGRGPGEFRAVRVEVDRRGAQVRTRRGYYP